MSDVEGGADDAREQTSAVDGAEAWAAVQQSMAAAGDAPTLRQVEETLAALLHYASSRFPEEELRTGLLPLIGTAMEGREPDASLQHSLLHPADDPNLLAVLRSPAVVEEIVWQMRNGGEGQRMRLLSASKRTFHGKDAADWVVAHVPDLKGSRPAARALCEFLQREKQLFRDHKDRPFRDDDTIFAFTQRKRVVIVGGGFGGSHLAKTLQHGGDYDVTLITSGPCFECIPSFPFIIGDAQYVSRIRAPHRQFLNQSVKIVRGTAAHVTERKVILSDGSSIAFDFAAIATGSAYRMPFEGEEGVFDATSSTSMARSNAALAHAKAAVVIGTGSVGIEVAGELAERFPDLLLTIVSSSDKFLERTIPDAHKTVLKFFQAKPNVSLVMGQRAASFSHDSRLLTTDKGAQIECDVVFPCMGFLPRTDLLRTHLPSCITKNKFADCDDSLQLKGQPHIFALGDIIPQDTEKLGQNAELHADLVATNMGRFDLCKRPKEYRATKKFMLISMGSKHCMLINGSHVITEGVTTRMLKNLVEYKVMRDFK